MNKRNKNYEKSVNLFLRELKIGSVTVVCEVKDVMIGNAAYTITGYRNPHLKSIYETFIIFSHEGVKDFMVRHNGFTSDARLKEILTNYFTKTEKQKVVTDLQYLKTVGYLGIPSGDNDTAMFNLIHEFPPVIVYACAA